MVKTKETTKPKAIKKTREKPEPKNDGRFKPGNTEWMKRTEYGQNGFYSNQEDLESAINEYFNNGVKLKQVEIGPKENKQIIEIPVPTITGLCFYCGFASRQSFYDMEKRPELTYIVKRARLFIEKEYEENLRGGNVAGSIFALKNMGWVDSQDLTVRDESEIQTPHEVMRRLAFMLRRDAEGESDR